MSRRRRVRRAAPGAAAATGRASRTADNWTRLEALGKRRPAQCPAAKRQALALRARSREQRLPLLDEPFGASTKQVRLELRDGLRGRKSGAASPGSSPTTRTRLSELADRVVCSMEGASSRAPRQSAMTRRLGVRWNSFLDRDSLRSGSADCIGHGWMSSQRWETVGGRAFIGADGRGRCGGDAGEMPGRCRSWRGGA